MEEEIQLAYNEEFGEVFKEGLCNPNFDAEILLICHVMVTKVEVMVTKEDVGNVSNNKGCSKNAMVTNVMMTLSVKNLPAVMNILGDKSI